MHGIKYRFHLDNAVEKHLRGCVYLINTMLKLLTSHEYTPLSSSGGLTLISVIRVLHVVQKRKILQNRNVNGYVISKL